MTNTEKQLLKLISASQFGKGNMAFTDCDYIAVLKEAKAQAVLGIVAPEIPQKYVSEKDFETIKNGIARQRAKYTRYLYEEDRLKNVLDSNAIPFVILKGNAAAMYYKNPACRNMGDVDFLVGIEDFLRAKEVLQSEGYVLTHEKLGVE